MQYGFKKSTAKTAVRSGSHLHYVKFNEHNNTRQSEAESAQCEGKQESHAFFEWMLSDVLCYRLSPLFPFLGL